MNDDTVASADYEPVADRDDNRGSLSSYIHPPDVILSPRADAWIYLCVSSFVGLASIARAHAMYSNSAMSSTSSSSASTSDAATMTTTMTIQMGTSAAVILSLLCINAVISLGVGMAYRFRPSLTILARYHLESISSALAVVFWVVCMAFYNTSSPSDPIMWDMCMTYNSGRWDANFFYSIWITGILSLYLLSDVLAGNYPSGKSTLTLEKTTATTNSRQTRTWILLLITSVLLFSFSIAERVGPMCSDSYLHNSPYCTSTTVSIVTSVLGALICLAQMVMCRFSIMSEQMRCRELGLPLENSSSSLAVRNASETLLALPALVGYACNVGFATGSGGSGANVGNVYVVSWLCLVLAMSLNVDYLGLHLTMEENYNLSSRSGWSGNPQRHRSANRGNTMAMLSQQEEALTRRTTPPIQEASDDSEEESDDESSAVSSVILAPRLMYSAANNSVGGQRPPTPTPSFATQESASPRPRANSRGRRHHTLNESLVTERSAGPSPSPRNGNRANSRGKRRTRTPVQAGEGSMATEQSGVMSRGGRSMDTEQSAPQYVRQFS